MAHAFYLLYTRILFGNIFFSLAFIMAETENEETKNIKTVDKVGAIDIGFIVNDKLRPPKVYNIASMDNPESSLI